MQLKFDFKSEDDLNEAKILFEKFSALHQMYYTYTDIHGRTTSSTKPEKMMSVNSFVAALTYLSLSSKDQK